MITKQNNSRRFSAIFLPSLALSFGFFPLVSCNLLPSKSATRALDVAVADSADKVILDDLKALERNTPRDLNGISDDIQLNIFKEINANAVTSLDQLAKYDPTGAIGFCFGRAMGTYLRARQYGLKPESIKRLFIIGDLRSTPNPEWRWHTTTLFQNERQEWMAIDPILEAPMPAKEWIKKVRSIWDKNNKAFVYLTSSVAVMPDLKIFADEDKETGERIIELKFDPKVKKGLTENLELGDAKLPVYALDAEAEQKLFSTVSEDDADRFQLHQMTINGDIYAFNNYFADLVADFAKFKPAVLGAAPRIASVEPTGVSSSSDAPVKAPQAKVVVKEGQNLYSMKFSIIGAKRAP